MNPDRAVRLLASGHSPAEIGRRLGVSRQAVSKALKRRLQGRRRVVLLLPPKLAAGLAKVPQERLEAALGRELRRINRKQPVP